ncbi:MAG TPA: DUF885 domain-containing protein [Polyangia bacterium]|nr:DUF885 domain-containing protein [Polyangia bacterium]
MRISLGVLVATLVGCAHPTSSPSVHAPPAPPASDFTRLVDAYFDAQFTYAPSSATAVGLHAHDRALEDLSRGRIEARVAELRGFVARLDGLPAAGLSSDESIDRAFLTSQARAELFDLVTLESWRRNPMMYARLPGEAVDALMKRAFAPATERLTSVVARLRAIPAVYAAARANLENPAPEHVTLALRMTKGSIGFFESATRTWAASATRDVALLERFRVANDAALAATRSFAVWLEHDLAPRARGAFALGAERYRELLRLQEMVETPLPALLAKGEAHLAADRAAFVETAAKIAPGRAPAAVILSLTAEHPTAADLIPSVARGLEAARTFATAHALVTFPSAQRPIVRETPPYARAAVFASMDTPGPFEVAGVDAYYYVTPVEPDWTPEHREEHLRMFNRYTTAMIDVHEAYPGHFLQFLYMPGIKSKVRKLMYTTSNVEGWAHYAEQMMIDEGFGGGDPKLRLAQLQEALLRDCRYVVAIKMHTQGMTVDEATRFFVEQGFQEQANGHEEALRGTYDPMYLAYTLGKLQIQALRDEFRKRTGGDLRAFHDAFVAQGGLPVAFIERLLLPPAAGR